MIIFMLGGIARNSNKYYRTSKGDTKREIIIDFR